MVSEHLQSLSIMGIQSEGGRYLEELIIALRQVGLFVAGAIWVLAPLALSDASVDGATQSTCL